MADQAELPPDAGETDPREPRPGAPAAVPAEPVAVPAEFTAAPAAAPPDPAATPALPEPAGAPAESVAAPPAPAAAPAPVRHWRSGWRPWALGLAVVAAAGAAAAAVLNGTAAPTPVATPPLPAAPPVAFEPTVAPVPPAARAASDLPTVTYLGRLPAGLPRDPAPMSPTLLTTVVRPQKTLAVYDRPGGRARVFLPRAIHGVPVHVPLVRRQTGWIGVLLPSGNRTIGWLPPGGWDTTTVRDQLVIRRKAHTLTWLRDGKARRTWTVSVGSGQSPTPLGRSFVFGRSALPGEVYAGLDVLALGAVPDDPDSVPAGLRGAHIGIHSWYQNTFGGNTSDGCVQVPQAGQRLLLANVTKGSGVLVLP
ncbi:L,D-transpeptidase [Pilimelia terevasa]|uniref:L,D-transpeptidase n=1 Tax=Pilimelia terevasa TaxID=53372 RepID=UPI001E40AAA1|nr:L,D-transpeptidase [Pilimelia terevasa]